jgi:hypothetical protein
LERPGSQFGVLLGRLIKKHPWLQWHMLQSWGISIVIALILFIGVRPIVDRLASAAQTFTISSVGTDIVDGYQQVYYMSQNGKTYITSGARNHTKPSFSGDWIVYNEIINGAGQIMLCYAPSNTTTQLTYSSTNQNMSLDGTKAVWERWVVDRWQIFFFNGASIQQVTSGNVSVRPSISGDSIAYAQQSNLGLWTAYKYSIGTGLAVPVGVGESAAWPRLVNGEVVLGFIGF